jgi:IMP cyclohydrolase
MRHSETIINYMKKNKGYITNKTVKGMGIPTVYLSRMVENKQVNKVDRGIYVLPHGFKDELYNYYLKYQKIIYSGNTALVLNGMSNRSLSSIEANVAYNYNTHRITEILVYRVNETTYNLGKVFIETEFGNLVPTYDKERVLCDIFIHNNLDSEALNYAIKAARSKKIDYEKLYDYAIKLNVYEKIKLLLEIRDE